MRFYSDHIDYLRGGCCLLLLLLCCWCRKRACRRHCCCRRKCWSCWCGGSFRRIGITHLEIPEIAILWLSALGLVWYINLRLWLLEQCSYRDWNLTRGSGGSEIADIGGRVNSNSGLRVLLQCLYPNENCMTWIKHNAAYLWLGRLCSLHDRYLCEIEWLGCVVHDICKWKNWIKMFYMIFIL